MFALRSLTRAGRVRFLPLSTLILRLSTADSSKSRHRFGAVAILYNFREPDLESLPPSTPQFGDTSESVAFVRSTRRSSGRTKTDTSLAFVSSVRTFSGTGASASRVKLSSGWVKFRLSSWKILASLLTILLTNTRFDGIMTPHIGIVLTAMGRRGLWGWGVHSTEGVLSCTLPSAFGLVLEVLGKLVLRVVCSIDRLVVGLAGSIESRGRRRRRSSSC